MDRDRDRRTGSMDRDRWTGIDGPGSLDGDRRTGPTDGTDGSGSTHRDRRTGTDGPGQTDRDRWTGIDGPGSMDRDRWTGIDGRGQTDRDRRIGIDGRGQTDRDRRIRVDGPGRMRAVVEASRTQYPSGAKVRSTPAAPRIVTAERKAGGTSPVEIPQAQNEAVSPRLPRRGKRPRSTPAEDCPRRERRADGAALRGVRVLHNLLTRGRSGGAPARPISATGARAGSHERSSQGALGGCARGCQAPLRPHPETPLKLTPVPHVQRPALFEPRNPARFFWRRRKLLRSGAALGGCARVAALGSLRSGAALGVVPGAAPERRAEGCA